MSRERSLRKFEMAKGAALNDEENTDVFSGGPADILIGGFSISRRGVGP